MSSSAPSSGCEDDIPDEEVTVEELLVDEESDGLLSAEPDELLSELEGRLSVFDEELLSLLLEEGWLLLEEGWLLLVDFSVGEELSLLLAAEDETSEPLLFEEEEV